MTRNRTTQRERWCANILIIGSSGDSLLNPFLTPLDSESPSRRETLLEDLRCRHQIRFEQENF